MLEVTNLKSSLLKQVSLKVAPGECINIGGASGSGKTLFLRALADLDENEGHIILDSVERQSLDAPEWRKKLRYLPAEPGFWAEKTGDHFADKQQSVKILEFLDMPAEAANWRIDRLSTGEKQRVGLAIGLADNPAVILADEPTSALDDESAKLVETLFRQRLAKGAILVLVSHDKAFAERLADRHFIVKNGDISERLP